MRRGRRKAAVGASCGSAIDRSAARCIGVRGCRFPCPARFHRAIRPQCRAAPPLTTGGNAVDRPPGNPSVPAPLLTARPAAAQAPPAPAAARGAPGSSRGAARSPRCAQSPAVVAPHPPPRSACGDSSTASAIASGASRARPRPAPCACGGDLAAQRADAGETLTTPTAEKRRRCARASRQRHDKPRRWRNFRQHPPARTPNRYPIRLPRSPASHRPGRDSEACTPPPHEGSRDRERGSNDVLGETTRHAVRQTPLRR